MRIRSDSIVNKNGDGSIQFSNGAVAAEGQPIIVQGNLNISGIATVGFLTAKNANITGVITATSFVGDGSQLTNIPTVNTSRSIALRYIIADPPLRS